MQVRETGDFGVAAERDSKCGSDEGSSEKHARHVGGICIAHLVRISGRAFKCH